MWWDSSADGTLWNEVKDEQSGWEGGRRASILFTKYVHSLLWVTEYTAVKYPLRLQKSTSLYICATEVEGTGGPLLMETNQ